MNAFQNIRFSSFLLSSIFVLFTHLVELNQSFGQENSDITVLSETETSYSGAVLLRNGRDVQLGALTEGRHNDLEDRERYLFWQGDSLFLGVIDTEDNNRLDVVAEFYWFESSLPRNSDFYVIVLKVTAAPSANTDWRIATPASLTDNILFRDIGSVHRVEAAVDRSGDYGAIRWDWSLPFQNDRWEPERVIEVEQEYTAGVHLEGSAMRDLSEGINVQAKGFLDAMTRVSTRYTITLWRWEMLVQAGATDMDWALVALSPEHEQDPAYHEYFLVLQAERNVPVRLDYLQFGTTFRKRVFLLPDDFANISVRLQNIQLTPPQNPCNEGQRLEDDGCVSICPENFEWNEDRCLPICPSGYEIIDGLCTEPCPPEHEREGRDCVRICLPEQINVNNECEILCEDGSISEGGVCQEDICPEGFYLTGSGCEPICAEDEIWNEDTCIPNCASQGMIYDGMVCVCPQGSELDGEVCVEQVMEEMIECTEGQVLRDERCVSICPSQYTWVNGQCILECQMGYMVQNDRCVPQKCPMNTQLIDGVCVSCPANTTLVDGTCLSCNPNVEDCNMGTSDNKGDGCVSSKHSSQSIQYLFILWLVMVPGYLRKQIKLIP